MTGIRHDVRNGFRENGSRLLRSIHTQIKVVHGILRSRLRFLRNMFDYLIYFTSGVPDGFRYCIKLEDDGCASYHRFIREDYEAFGF